MLRHASPRWEAVAGAAKAGQRQVTRLASTSAARTAPSMETHTATVEVPIADPPFASSSSPRVPHVQGITSRFPAQKGLRPDSTFHERWPPTYKQKEQAIVARQAQLDTTKQHRSRLAEIVAPNKVDDEPQWYQWLLESPQAARRYTEARARLWLPNGISQQELDRRIKDFDQDLLTNDITLHAAKASERVKSSDEIFQAYVSQRARFAREQLQVWRGSNREVQLDVVLRESWVALTEAEQEAAVLRSRYECLRRVGWRKGYSSGYPLTEKVDADTTTQREEMLRLLREGRTADRRQAFTILRQQENEMAKVAWTQLSEEARKLEERAAWDARDRSIVYLDDTSTSNVLGTMTPRWFATPQRSGEMTFLPNTTIRLVPNGPVRNGKYDTYKATFRVPLSMHKHGVRSYLLAVYGLRTTWARSMIYRKKVFRNRLGQLAQRGGSQHTYKKVEVGLLEPFIYPDISPAFKRAQLYVHEQQANERKTLLRLSGRRRWRARMLAPPVKPTEAIGSVGQTPVEEGEELVDGSDRADEADVIDRPKAKVIAERGAKPASKDAQRTLFWSGGIPTARHSRILALIREKQVGRDQQIKERAESLQLEGDERAADQRRRADRERRRS